MKRNRTETVTGPVAHRAHAAFAVTMILVGILGLIRGDFTPIWLPVSKGVPIRQALVYLTAVVPLLCGLGLLWRRTAALASGVLLTVFLAWLLLLDAPQLASDFGMQLTWASCKTATMVAAAWVLYIGATGCPGGQRFAPGTGDPKLRIPRALYGLALIPFGIAHFTYIERTASMVPGWLPWHLAWAYLFGCTFIAAGLAVLIGVYARLAATLSVVQLGMFTLLVWVPVVATGPSASDWREFVVSWVLTSAAWVVAESYRGMPWFPLWAQSSTVS